MSFTRIEESEYLDFIHKDQYDNEYENWVYIGDDIDFAYETIYETESDYSFLRWDGRSKKKVSEIKEKINTRNKLKDFLDGEEEA